MWCCGKVDVVVPGVAPSAVSTLTKNDTVEEIVTNDLIDEILVEELNAEAEALARAKEEELTQDTVVGILGIAFLFTVAYLMLNSKDNDTYRIQHHIDL
jgi:hypothetical protein